MQETKDIAVREQVYSQAEDAALKAAAQFFGEELFSYLGIEEKPIGIAPTEMVHLEIKKMYEDFNFLMKDDRWLHIEFESDSITREDLRRFREYEAVTSRTYGVEVTTIVVCSSTVKELMSEITEGINVYKVKVVRLKDMDAAIILKKLSEMEMSSIKKEDLVPLLLTPLMSGEIPEKERVRQGFFWLNQEYPEVNKEDLSKMQAVLYALAVKILKSSELAEIKEAIAMTILGQMLVEDGIRKGRQEGIEEGRQEGIEAGRQEGIQLTKAVLQLTAKGETPEAIARCLDIPEETVQQILLIMP